ncbi:MAG: hypothetical protein CME61_03545 [Halobacteriovoraceae bacterium]|nr:hypothetical protein [Halobacteriovoraceae bacterium]|tara:strand:+ start:27 stop:1013 length:987 start_codon:yes stop_codon:yes gene_type:complete
MTYLKAVFGFILFLTTALFFLVVPLNFTSSSKVNFLIGPLILYISTNWLLEKAEAIFYRDTKIQILKKIKIAIPITLCALCLFINFKSKNSDLYHFKIPSNIDSNIKMINLKNDTLSSSFINLKEFLSLLPGQIRPTILLKIMAGTFIEIDIAMKIKRHLEGNELCPNKKHRCYINLFEVLHKRFSFSTSGRAVLLAAFAKKFLENRKTRDPADQSPHSKINKVISSISFIEILDIELRSVIALKNKNTKYYNFSFIDKIPIQNKDGKFQMVIIDKYIEKLKEKSKNIIQKIYSVDSSSWTPDIIGDQKSELIKRKLSTLQEISSNIK